MKKTREGDKTKLELKLMARDNESCDKRGKQGDMHPKYKLQYVPYRITFKLEPASQNAVYTEKDNSGPVLKNFQEADSSEFVKEISGICIP
jgi:hypothetical protein